MKLLNIISDKFNTNLSINLDHVYAIELFDSIKDGREIELVAYLIGASEDSDYYLLQWNELEDGDSVPYDEALDLIKGAHKKIAEFMVTLEKSLTINI